MLTLRGVTKRFGSLTAVDDVSFSVSSGEVVGFLGANGAGKSTTLRMLAGYIRPDAGELTVCGHDVCRDGVAARACIGYLPENAPVYSDMTVDDFLSYCAGLRGAGRAERREQTARAALQTGLTDMMRRRIGTLSKGYVHRVCLAQALLHEPPVLLLDEPTDGLDPFQKREVRRLIRRLGETCAIMVSSHILEEVEAMCTRVLILEHGRIRLDEPLDAVRGRLASLFGPAGEGDTR